MLEQFLAIAVLVEVIGESIWWTFDGEWNRERLGALVLGELVAILTGLNVLTLSGLTPADYIPDVVWLAFGVVGTGLVVMRGANAVHDLWKRLRGDV